MKNAFVDANILVQLHGLYIGCDSSGLDLHGRELHEDFTVTIVDNGSSDNEIDTVARDRLGTISILKFIDLSICFC